MEFINKGRGDGEIILSDGKNEAYFEFIDMYVVDGKEYAVLIEDGDDMITIMGFTEACGKEPEKFYEIQDDEIFTKVLALYENDME